MRRARARMWGGQMSGHDGADRHVVRLKVDSYDSAASALRAHHGRRVELMIRTDRDAAGDRLTPAPLIAEIVLAAADDRPHRLIAIAAPTGASKLALTM